MSLSSGALTSLKRDLNTTPSESLISEMTGRHPISSMVSARALDAYICIDATFLPVNCVSQEVALLEHGHRRDLFVHILVFFMSMLLPNAFGRLRENRYAVNPLPVKTTDARPELALPLISD